MTTSTRARRASTRLNAQGVTYDEQRRRGQAFAKAIGWKGTVGGWFFDSNDKPVCQGFADLYALFQRRADELAGRTA